MSESSRPQELAALMPLARTLGITIESSEPEEVCGSLAWSPDLCTAGGVLHGGALMALTDSLGGICAYLNLPPGKHTATVSSSTVFIRAVRAGALRATARPLHIGASAVVVQTDVVDGDGRRVAQTTQTQAVLAQR